MAIYNAKRIVIFSFVVIVSGMVISFLWADKILYGSEILFLKSRDFQWFFFHDFVLEFVSHRTRTPTPVTPS